MTSHVARLIQASPPAVTVQPVSVTATQGANKVFVAVATGTAPLAYQWQFNGTNLSNSTNVAGVNDATLNLNYISGAEAGEYTVIVTNMAGAASNTGTLVIATPPSIDPPLQNLSVLAGQSATFSLNASGTGPLSYQWEFNGTNALEATDATLSLTNVSLDQAGIYSVIVTNLAGVASNSATLSVYASAAATLSALPSFSGGQFQFTVTGVPGFNYVIEASTNFIDWEPLVTNASPFTLTDDEATNFPARFYRATYAP